MFKKLSIIALSVTAIALTGCSNQAKDDTDSKPKTEKVTKNKKNSTKKTTTDSTNKVADNNGKEVAPVKPTTNNNSAANNTNNSTNNNQNNNSQTTNITNGEDAVTYLFTKLTNIDKTQISGLFNGTVYDNDGKSTYRVNLYKKGEQQPYTAYNVYADGTYTQVW